MNFDRSGAICRFCRRDIGVAGSSPHRCRQMRQAETHAQPKCPCGNVLATGNTTGTCGACQRDGVTVRPKEVTVKRYMLFAAEWLYDHSGGWNEFVAAYDTIDELKRSHCFTTEAPNAFPGGYRFAQIVDATSLSIIETWDPDYADPKWETVT